MNLTPLVKVQGNKFYQCDWIIDNFPENYQSLDYIELYAGGASVLLNKLPSRFEVFNDLDSGIVQIHRAMRDEPGIFISRLKRIKYCLSTFQRAKRRAETEFEDYLDFSVNEFIIRRMSVAGNKQVFGGSEKSWGKVIKELKLVANRLKTVHIFQKEAKYVLNAYSSLESFAYADPPELDDTDESIRGHCDLANALNNFMGKAMISGKICVLQKRLYKSWRCVKKQETKEAIWMNY